MTYPHPLLERVLGETYGIMVYQEQVMQAAQVLGGYSLGGADLLRRAMGKKKPEEMAKHRAIFREGAAKKEIAAEVADEVFDLMEKFAGYGFNKSHAAAYSLLAYHTAWIKVHFPAEFFAANMTVEIDNSDKLKALLVDARSFGVTIETPDVNTGTYRFEPVSPTVGALRPRRGEGHGPGRDRGDRRRAPRRRPVQEPVRLLRPGRPRPDQPPRRRGADQGRRLRRAASRALDACSASVGLALDWADTAGRARRPGRPVRLRRPTAATCTAPARRSRRSSPAPPWSIKERLTLEKAALGFYLSGHLFDQSAAEVRRFVKLQHRRPDRQPRADAARRHRRRPARRQRPARPGRDCSSSTT